MFDSTSPLSVFTPVQRVNTSASQTNAATGTQEDTFQQMLMTSMLSGMSSSGEEGMDSSMLLLPLMLSLIEKLIEQQVEVEQEEDTSISGTSPEVQASSDLTGRTGPTTQPSGRPVGGYLTQGYHGTHYGLDFGIPVGTPVQSTMDGKVVYAGWNNEGYGNLVIVENGPYRTYYAHLSEIPVRIGDSVSAGGTIGLSGNTGNSTGPHLHYEARYQMKPIDPTSFTLSG